MRLESLVVSYHIPPSTSFFLHMHGIRHSLRIYRSSFHSCIAPHHCICLWFHSMHIIFNLNLLHEGHSMAYTTCVGGKGKFTTAIRDECGISWIFRKCRSGIRTHTGKENVSLTFWSSGRSRQRKRTASYSSARVGDVRHGSRAIQVLREKGKRG